jgi:hypothetical protein
MESLSKTAGRLVMETEVNLRKLIARAAEQADYGSVQQLGAVAGQLSQIGRTLGAESFVESGAIAAVGRAQERRSNKTSAQTERKKRREYPRFETRNGTLCKIGWSKKSKSEYEHRVPRETVERVICAIEGAGGLAGELFTAEDVLKHLNDESVPIYQVYVVIALLRDRNMLQKQGKDGYLIREPLALSISNGSFWDTLTDG